MKIGVKKLIQEGHYYKVAIGVNIFLINSGNKTSVLRILIYDNTLQEKLYDYPYTLSHDKKVIFSPDSYPD